MGEKDEDIARLFLKAIGLNEEQIEAVIEYFIYLNN